MMGETFTSKPGSEPPRQRNLKGFPFITLLDRTFLVGVGMEREGVDRKGVEVDKQEVADKLTGQRRQT